MNSIKEKIIRFLDTSEYNRTNINVMIGIIIFFSSKFLGANGSMAILITVGILSFMALIFQIVRKDRHIKGILSYLFATIFITFIAVDIWFIDKYDQENNLKMMANMCKLLALGIVVPTDIAGIIFIMQKDKPRKNKIIILVIMLYFTSMLGVLVCFFSSQGV